MKQHHFEQHHQAHWKYFEEQLGRLEKNNRKNKVIAEDASFPENYQMLCQQLALAQARNYTSALTSYLQFLVKRGHQLLYKHRSHFGHSILNFIFYEFPQAIRQEKKLFIITSTLFYGTLLASAMITVYYPDFIYFFMSSESVNNLESMYLPTFKSVGPLTLRDADTNWFMFAYYIMNNISIGFQIFAGGVLFCLGTLFYLIFNGLSIGTVAAHITMIGSGSVFWPFVIGHSSFELTALIIAATGGMKLGLALLFPKRKTRIESLRYVSKTAIKLMLGAFALLLIAAFIEGYWSSMNGANALRYSVGVLLWLLLFSYFSFAGRQGNSHAI